MKPFLLAALFQLPLASAPVHVQAPAAHIDLSTEKVATIIGQVNDQVARNFDLQFALTSNLPGDRLVLIDSPGGLVSAGQKMIDTMETERRSGIRQICVVLHDASSMAFNFLSRCDVRLALPKAAMLMHKIADGGIDCITQRCTAKRLREAAKDLDEGDAPYRKANAAALGMTLKDYDLFCDNEHIWTTDTLLKRGYLAGTAEMSQ